MILLEHHKQAKREIIARFTQLAEVADAVGMVTLARDIRTTRIPKLEAERFHLVVLGEFNHGKSTFVNALLGQDVLPTGITPTTAAINHVVYAANPTAKVVLTSGESKYLDPSQIKEWVTVAGGHASEVAYVELGFPSDLLQNNVVLVDTPGVNDLNEQRAEVTCDRAALLAVRDLDKTLAAMVRLELGLDKGSAFNAEEYLRAMPDVKKGLGRFAEMFRSNPYVPKRVAALRLFAGSALYAQITGQDPTGKPNMNDVDKQVTDLISVF